MTDIDSVLQKYGGQIEEIFSDEIILDEPFLDFASRFAPQPGTVVLISGGDLDCSRYHILGIRPWLILSGRHRALNLTIDGVGYSFKADPFRALRRVLEYFKSSGQNFKEIAGETPICAGLLGYLSYDLKDAIEKLPRTSIDTLELPHILFYAPSAIVVHDKQHKSTTLFIPLRTGGNFCRDNWEKAISEYKNHLVTATSAAAGGFSGDPYGFRSNFSKTDYIRSIERIIEYIKAGDVYQVNMSQRFEMDFTGDSYALFKNLYEKNPAPFFAYLNAGDHQIISTSPERFLLRRGNRVETRPIKGTRPRGKDQAEDEKWKAELVNSRKDDAELSMIVDLLRNDIGKVCEAGSVRVVEHKRLEPYQNVYHLVSIAEGTLGENRDAVDLIKATFPGGSITGCPKIRSMEIIDELEPHRRHIYTGSIGYISFHDTLDLSIAIRTATVHAGKIYFSVGGGIVYDSEPENEFDETLHKGKTLMAAFAGRGKSVGHDPKCWINGVIKPVKLASVPVFDEGFQYGSGIFETIRVADGVPLLFDQHLERFHKSWMALFSDRVPDLSWDEIIKQVIMANRFENMVSAVKIIATAGYGDAPVKTRTLLVMARPYTHRLAGKPEQGLDLVTCPQSRQTPLADHKTMNYLYYLRAGRWALAKGGDEALILNPDGSVSETNTANILLLKDGRVIRPASPHVLPGIMEKKVLQILHERGISAKVKKVAPRELFESDQVLLTNSLMGAVPVLSLDRSALPKSSGLWQKINQIVL